MSKGNLTFKEEEDSIRIIETDLVEIVSKLLNVEVEELQTALRKRVIAAKGEIMEKNLTLSEGKFVADALAKVRFVPIRFRFSYFCFRFSILDKVFGRKFKGMEKQKIY
mgnify:CR=1 FL=1